MAKGKVVAVLTDEMTSIIKKDLNLEVEMLQGDQRRMPNGQTRYEFYVDDNKGEIIRELILKLISQSDKIILN